MKFSENWGKIIKPEGNTDKRQSYHVNFLKYPDIPSNFPFQILPFICIL